MVTTKIRQGGSIVGLPMLGGCAEGVEGIALGLVALAALFVILLFAVPPVMDHLRRREHRDLMVNRRPWSDKAASRKRSGRGERG